MENFITTDMFLSLTGCITIVMVATQILKKYVNFDAKWLALIFSIIVTAIRIVVIGDYTTIGIITGIFNIIPILFSSIGGYETLVKPVAVKISREKGE